MDVQAIQTTLVEEVELTSAPLVVVCWHLLETDQLIQVCGPFATATDAITWADSEPQSEDLEYRIRGLFGRDR